MMRLEYITLKEAAEQLNVTEDEVLRMAEQGLLRLHARSGPHGFNSNWRVHTKYLSVFRGDLSYHPHIPARLASQLLSRPNSSIEVKTVILKSAEFLPISGAENIQSIKVLSLGDEFRKVMAVGVSQEKFRKGIA